MWPLLAMVVAAFAAVINFAAGNHIAGALFAITAVVWLITFFQQDA